MAKSKVPSLPKVNISLFLQNLIPAFVASDDFIIQATNIRWVFIAGRPGGCKTALSVWLALELVRLGFAERIIANFPIEFGMFPRDAYEKYGRIERTVIVLDEAGFFADSWKNAKRYVGFIRKDENILLLPSVLPVSARLQTLKVFLDFNLQKTGIPMWIYQYMINTPVMKYKSRFGVTFPNRIFSLYDSRYIPKDDGGLEEAMLAQYPMTERSTAVKENSMEDAASMIIDAVEDQSNVLAEAAKRVRRVKR